MDQNRCLLDVIDNPQLLQSFLESETNAAELANNNQSNSTHVNGTPNDDFNETTHITNDITSSTSSDPTTSQVHSSLTTADAINQAHQETEIATASHLTASQTQVENAREQNEEHQDHEQFDSDPLIDPVVSVLDSIITETVAETSPSTHNARDDNSPALQDVKIEPVAITGGDSQPSNEVDIGVKANKDEAPSNKTSTAAKPETAPKPKRNTSRSKKAKNAPAISSAAMSIQTPNTPVQTRSLQPNQYITTPSSQQIIFQGNNAIRQSSMVGSSPMSGQPMTGVPQPQRVIQIQTPNGPMYFAIAPGPAANLNNGTNNNIMNHQQTQQPGMQSQYPSQQICFQPTSNIMMNRPQLSSPIMHQQIKTQQQGPQSQQMTPQRPIGIRQTMISTSGQTMMVGGHQMIQSQQPTRISSPMVAGQTVAMANQQNSQHPQSHQHIVLPSSQPMMMPRVPNQILVNRPMSGSGPMITNQQQFIQIMTANGPMLLALPTQPAQPVNNTMIDFNNQLQTGQQPVRHSISMHTQPTQLQSKPLDSTDGTSSSPTKGSGAKNPSNSKSGLDLADLLLDCGILPEDKTASQTSGSMKSSQSPSLSQISSPMAQTLSPLPTSDPNTFSNHSHSIPNYTTQPTLQQQPVRITIGPDGQMIMQPAVYGAVRPILASPVAQSSHISTIAPSNVIASGTNMIAMTTSSPSTPKTTSETSQNDNSKKATAKGKNAAVKRSRSKKSDVDKFPQLKTPKIAQQQQQQQQQQQEQQQLQSVTVVPMTVLATSSDQKPNVTQLASGQQVPLAKFVTPVVQAGCPPQSSVVSNILQANAQTVVSNQTQLTDSGQLNTALNSGESISTTVHQQQPSHQQNPNFGTVIATPTSNSQLSSSGNVHTNLLKSDHKIGTVESNPHISSSLTPNLSLTVDNLKIEQDGLKNHPGTIQTSQSVRGLVQNIGGVTTIVLKPASACIQIHQQQQQQQNQIEIQKAKELQQQQQLARQKEIRAQNIINQLGADQYAALNPQTKQAFVSVEDACKRLLRYHVFDTETVSEAKIRRVDEIFDAAVESLITRKQAIYDKFRFLVLKQSMKIVPSSEKVMLEQLFVNDELSYLKKERELFREYEAHLENMALKQAKVEPKEDSKYFAFGQNSPKQKVKEHDQDSATHSRDVEDWLISDKWADSRYPSVPDSEAATAIESILNEEIG